MAIISSVEIEEGTDWKISIPTQGLTPTSILIDRTRIDQTGQENPSELFKMMNKVARFWEEKGIVNYLIYKSSKEQGWEMVPVKGDKSSLLDRMRGFVYQISVIGRVIFGRYTRAESARNYLYTEYAGLASFEGRRAANNIVQRVAQEVTILDAFCKKEVIDSQLLFEGKHVRVLYNYAPIGSEGLHFLLVPKAHKERFSELSQEEFEEVQTFAQTLMQHYPDHICHRYNKTGSLIGQTVPHFHEHVVFILPQHELRGQLSVFFRMIMPPRPLSAPELATRVSQLKAQFTAL